MAGDFHCTAVFSVIYLPQRVDRPRILPTCPAQRSAAGASSSQGEVARVLLGSLIAPSQRSPHAARRSSSGGDPLIGQAFWKSEHRSTQHPSDCRPVDGHRCGQSVDRASTSAPLLAFAALDQSSARPPLCEQLHLPRAVAGSFSPSAVPHRTRLALAPAPVPAPAPVHVRLRDQTRLKHVGHDCGRFDGLQRNGL